MLVKKVNKEPREPHAFSPNIGHGDPREDFKGGFKGFHAQNSGRASEKAGNAWGWPKTEFKVKRGSVSPPAVEWLTRFGE
jgi:hypothetical protein